MRYALALAAAAGVVLAGCDGGHDHDSHEHKHDEKAADAKVKDPVCGMEIAKGTLKTEFDKADVYFCSEGCAAKFKAEPTKYLKACTCAKTMKHCDCEHCDGKREPCDCGQEK